MKIRNLLAHGPWVKNLLPLITAVLITITGIWFKASPLTVLPLYISIVVTRLQSDANRYMLLIGALNSLIYATVYFTKGLYSDAVYAIIASFGVQFFGFRQWGKRKSKAGTVFRKMPRWLILLTVAAAAVAYGILCWFYLAWKIEAPYMLLDNAVVVVGTVTTLLTALSFREYPYSFLLGNLLSSALYLWMFPQHPDMLTHLIMMANSIVSGVFALLSVRKICRRQAQNKEET